MRVALLSLIVAAALAAPASAQPPRYYSNGDGIYPSLFTFPSAQTRYGTYPIVPARNTPLSPMVASYPFIANGQVYTMGQMYQAYGFVPYSAYMTPSPYVGYRSRYWSR